MASYVKKVASEDQIKEQITTTRDLDSESTRPKFPPTRRDKTPSSTKESSPEETSVEKKSRSKPPSHGQSEQQTILLPFMRFMITGVPRPETSKFIPSSHSMYYTVHIMDDIMRKNAYFKKQQDAWHPFISRLYFGIIFIIQTIRSEIVNNIASPTRKSFYKQFCRDYPPEALPVPGPLVTLFECLSSAKPANTLEAIVTPFIPAKIGPVRSSTLIQLDDQHAAALLIPNIPGLLGLIGTITSAAPNAIPDYSNPNTFSDQAAFLLNGSPFEAHNWTENQRNFLLTPGMLHLAETDSTTNQNANAYAGRLNLPIPGANDDQTSISKFMYLDTTNEWFGNILQIMECYCEYFRGSTTLATCDTTFTVSPLLTTVYPHYNGFPTDQNPYTSLNRALPDKTVFKLDTYHQTTERDLAPASTALAQCAALNITLPEGIPHWQRIGTLGITRFGPYWSPRPVTKVSKPDSVYKSLGPTITKDFALQRPAK